MKKRILALDLGTHLGWAKSPLESGVVDLSNRRGESVGMRFVHWRRWLEIMLQSGVDIVVYEDVKNHKGVQAAHIYGGLLSILQERCEVLKIEYTHYGVGEIKRHATAKGNAKKEAMVAAAEQKWPEITIEDDNHADALWLLSLANKMLGVNHSTEEPCPK